MIKIFCGLGCLKIHRDMSLRGLLKIRPYMSHKPLEIERFDAKYPKSEAILVNMV